MLRRLEELSNLIGVSGDEGRVRRYIKAELANIDGLDMKTDAMGNLIVHKAGKGPKVMVAAHMDEVGMIVIGALDNGLIAYGQRGIDSRVVVSKRVLVGDEMIEGVIGAKAIHLQTAADRKTVLGHSELFVDIGAKDKDDALKYVKPGDRIGFATKFKRLGEKRVLGKALDDRVGCAILMQLLANDYECDFYGVFTVQEEVGTRGGQVTAQRIQPDIGVAVDVTPCHDRPGDLEGSNALDHGVAIKISDTGSISDEGLVNKSIALCKEHNVPYQKDVIYVGGTDASAMTLVGGGIKTIGFSVVTRYTHGPNAIVSQKDIEATVKMLELFMNADFE